MQAELILKCGIRFILPDINKPQKCFNDPFLFKLAALLSSALTDTPPLQRMDEAMPAQPKCPAFLTVFIVKIQESRQKILYFSDINSDLRISDLVTLLGELVAGIE
jgi:hypothetical protein